MIVNGSRYQNQPLLMIVDDAGNSNLTVFASPRSTTNNFVYHKVIDGDRFDNLAAAYFNDSRLWWKIADVNPEVFYPENLVSGTLVRIPTS